MSLDESRDRITKIDDEIIELLVQRFKIVKEIAFHKFKNNLPLKDTVREKTLIEDRNKKFEKLGFKDPNFVSVLYNIIIKKSIKLQKNFMKNHKDKADKKKIN